MITEEEELKESQDVFDSIASTGEDAVLFALHVSSFTIDDQEQYDYAKGLIVHMRSKKTVDDKDHPLEKASVRLERLIKQYDDDRG